MNFTDTGKGKNFKGRKKQEVKLKEFTDLCNLGNTLAKTTAISSAGKESTCNVGDPRSIPGMGRSPGEGIGYPLQYSWAALVAQLVRIHLQRGRIWVQSLGWEDRQGHGNTLQCSCLENPMDRGAWRATVLGVAKSRTRLSD